MKMLITLEPHGIFQSELAYLYILHMFETQVCKTVISFANIFMAKPSHRFAYLCLDNVKCIRALNLFQNGMFEHAVQLPVHCFDLNT